MLYAANHPMPGRGILERLVATCRNTLALQYSSQPCVCDLNKELDTPYFMDLNSVVKFVKDRVAPFISADLQDVPANDIQSFIFPGTKVFTYKVVNFSDNQDLIALITYIRPS